ncbi:MAG: hypothetical protein M3138_00310, partial [Actinomycetota bacterium]|nr:hypothetical protein [Actinomycetota bacterium]
RPARGRGIRAGVVGTHVGRSVGRAVRWLAATMKMTGQIEHGRMTEAGLAKIAEARRNGRWDGATPPAEPSS